ncbi:hypothetical protein GCM10027359_01080 [Marilutibacter aestuarii]
MGTAHAATPWTQARQMVVVTTPDWDADGGRMQRFEKHGAGWRPVAASEPVRIGRAGSAWGLGLHPDQPGTRKREGDGRSPAGIFGIGDAFGYAADARTALPYRSMQAGDYCIDVPGSPLYNRIVNTEEVGAAAVKGSTEPMRRDLHADGDQRYAQGFVIDHNPGNRSPAGSCIFAHVWKAADVATAGCTAMPPERVAALLDWLDPAAQPVFVLLPEAAYARLQAPWHLPVLPPVPTSNPPAAKDPPND